MREILFRGKRIDNGEWTEGYLFKQWNRTFLLWGMTGDIPNMTEVIPETVGQFTGLTDKNGKKIFEGDVVEYAGSCGEIVFVERRWAFMSRERDMYCEWLSNLPQYGTGIVEIIGNIYDNKEILESKE